MINYEVNYTIRHVHHVCWQLTFDNSKVLLSPMLANPSDDEVVTSRVPGPKKKKELKRRTKAIRSSLLEGFKVICCLYLFFFEDFDHLSHKSLFE